MRSLRPTREKSRILVNARFLGRRMTGVERYALEVTRRLGNQVGMVAPFRSLQGLAGHLWEQAYLPYRVSSQNLLWSPANSGPLSVENQVVTLHDLSVIDHPEWFRSSFAAWYSYLLPRLVKRVRKVITDSIFSKSRILEEFCISEDKVAIIPAGVDLTRFWPRSAAEISEVRSYYHLPQSYVLWVGTLEPRKNLPGLLQAWQRVHTQFPEVQLVLVGGKVALFRDAQMKNGLEGVHLSGYVPDADLPAFYSGALAFILPSLYEGFGLPALEAMACGVGVIASDRAALPEVVGQAGLLVNPTDTEDIASAIARMLSDEALRLACSRKGLERAKSFSYDLTAERIFNELSQLLG